MNAASAVKMPLAFGCRGEEGPRVPTYHKIRGEFPNCWCVIPVILPLQAPKLNPTKELPPGHAGTAADSLEDQDRQYRMKRWRKGKMSRRCRRVSRSRKMGKEKLNPTKELSPCRAC